MEGYFVHKVGNNRGAPRIWLEGQKLAKAGISPGTKFDIVINGKTIVLKANKDGSRVVSGKMKGDKPNPVIDINSRELLALFDGMAAVRVVVRKGEVYILPLASEIRKQERFQRLKRKLESGEPLLMGSLSHGGGILASAIHQGLQDSGIETKLAFANEIRPELLEHAAEHNDAWSDDTQVVAAPMQELAFDQKAMQHLESIEILEAGIPCSGASKAGIAKRGTKGHPEAHPEVGHLVVSALVIISKTNPAVVLIENVPSYGNSASADILRNQLRDLGYLTHEAVLNGAQWNQLEARERWVCVAVSEQIDFDFKLMKLPAHVERTLGEVLEPIPLDDPRWSEMEGLKLKQERDALEGKNFKMQIFDENSPKVGTITKGYGKIRSTDPKIRNSENPDLLRQLSAKEHARVKGIPEHLIDGLSTTTAHEVMGQSVIYPVFRSVGETMGQALLNVVAEIKTNGQPTQKQEESFELEPPPSSPKPGM